MFNPVHISLASIQFLPRTLVHRHRNKTQGNEVTPWTPPSPADTDPGLTVCLSQSVLYHITLPAKQCENGLSASTF